MEIKHLHATGAGENFSSIEALPMLPDCSCVSLNEPLVMSGYEMKIAHVVLSSKLITDVSNLAPGRAMSTSLY